MEQPVAAFPEVGKPGASSLASGKATKEAQGKSWSSAPFERLCTDVTNCGFF